MNRWQIVFFNWAKTYAKIIEIILYGTEPCKLILEDLENDVVIDGFLTWRRGKIKKDYKRMNKDEDGYS